MTNLKQGIVRILGVNGQTVGTGFILTGTGFIVTCAHVIKSAGAGPDDLVHLVFCSIDAEADAIVVPKYWRNPEVEDIAILQLDGSLPQEVKPLLLGTSTGVEGHEFKTYGFPDVGQVNGLSGYGKLGDFTEIAGQRVLQLTDTTEVTGGFSGGPVWDKATKRVVGMITATTSPDERWRLTETAFITPSEILQDVSELQISDICPYFGLAAFTEENAEFFFGRTELVEQLKTTLKKNPRLLIVVGPSGSGKSSVVQAGLFPVLKKNKQCLYFLNFRPGRNPFSALQRAGLDMDGAANLISAIKNYLDSHKEIERFILFADQFEELFVLTPKEIQTKFIEDLSKLLKTCPSVTIILTLRADFYGELLSSSFLKGDLESLVDAAIVNVRPMKLAELKEAIIKPAKQVGLVFQDGLIDNISEEASEVDYPLPLLESALTELWKKRTDHELTHKAYDEIGKVTGAISTWADNSYYKLTSNEQELSRYIFTKLIHYGTGIIVDTRQRLPLAELIPNPEQKKLVQGVVTKLADARLLVTGNEIDSVRSVEIIHDALLREWGQLKEWVKKHREFLLWRQRLDIKKEEWVESDRDKGALLRGAILAEAESWLQTNSEDLNAHEREFIETSISEKNRLDRLFQYSVLGVATLILITFIVGLFLYYFSTRSYQLSEDISQAQKTSTSVITTLEKSQADQAAAEATVTVAYNNQGTAEANRKNVEKQAAEALATKETAEASRNEAEIEATIAYSNQATAEANRDEAEIKATIAYSNQATAEANRDEALATKEAAEAARLEAQKDLTVATTALAQTNKEINELNINASSINLANQSLSQSDPELSLRDAVQAAKITFDAELDLPLQSYRALLRSVFNPFRGVLDGQKDSIRVQAFSPDGRLFATGSDDGTVRIWNVETNEKILIFNKEAHSGGVVALTFAPDTNVLATAGRDNTARLWDGETGDLKLTLSRVVPE